MLLYMQSFAETHFLKSLRLDHYDIRRNIYNEYRHLGVDLLFTIYIEIIFFESYGSHYFQRIMGMIPSLSCLHVYSGLVQANFTHIL